MIMPNSHNSHNNNDSGIPPDAMDVLKQFRSVFNTIKHRFQHVEDVCRISGAQLWALSVVARRPGLRVSDLAKAMAVHQSTASNLIDRLVELKMVTKSRSEQDQRVVHLLPTPEGAALVARAPQPLEGRLPEALGQMNPEDLLLLHTLLIKLLSILNTTAGVHVPLTEIAIPSLMTPQIFSKETLTS
jgi:DNA-binding MarR family transcriptional regulator